MYNSGAQNSSWTEEGDRDREAGMGEILLVHGDHAVDTGHRLSLLFHSTF